MADNFREMPTFYDAIDKLFFPPDRLTILEEKLMAGEPITEEDCMRVAALQDIDMARLGRNVARETINHMAQMLYVDESIQLQRKDSILDLHAEAFGYERDKRKTDVS